MPEFTCRVGTPAGEVRLETHVSPNAETLRQELERRDLHVFDVKPRSAGIRIGRWRIGGGAKRVPRRQFLLFNQEFVTLLRAGLPLLQALDVLLERMKPGPFQRYLSDIRDRVRAGSALSEAFMAQGEAFPRVYGASLTAGERSGELPAVMARYVDFARKTERVRGKVFAALLYPTLLSVLSVGLVIFLMLYILPRFASFYEEFDQKLPALTTMLIGLARWLQGNAVILGVLVVGGFVAARLWRDTDQGRLFFDRVKLHVPLVGPVMQKYNTSQFARTLSTLLAGGIPLVTSLQTVTTALSNRVFTDAVDAIAEDVRQGKSLWESIEATGVMSDLTIEMVKVGEATGALALMLGSVSEFYDEQVDEDLTRIVSLFEPILLLVMGVIVAIVLLAMYLPIFNLAGAGSTGGSRIQMADESRSETHDAVATVGGVADEVTTARRLAERLSYRYVDLREEPVDHGLFTQVPVDLMFRYDFVPLRRDGDYLTVVMSDPTDVLMIDELELQLGVPLRVAVGTHGAIQEVLKKSESSQRVLDEATEGFRIQVLKEDEDEEESLSMDRLTSDTSPIIKLVDSVIFNALQRRTSDIHIETREHEVIVKYRIDGVLYQAMEPIDKKFHSTIISRIKVMSELDIAEKRIPQDGRFKLKVKGRAIDFRVSIMPSVHGEDAVIRILDKESANEAFKNLSLEVLGWPEPDLKRFRKFIREPYGMVLVTGPTGSGKTTTLYAGLLEIRSEEDKIVTIEDPVEYVLEGITQIPVNEKKGLTFARGLRSILRHDPDKIMVGEIRDEETAQIAVQSALTGHLVFTTVHANNVVDVLGRFLNMKVDLYNFVSALNCILAQRLVRLACSSCRRPVKYSRTELVESGLDPSLTEHVFYEGRGCIDCNGTGYHGREAITELLDMSDRIRELILARRPASEIRAAAREEGMLFLRDSAVNKLLLGRTTLREINKVTFVD